MQELSLNLSYSINQMTILFLLLSNNEEKQEYKSRTWKVHLVTMQLFCKNNWKKVIKEDIQSSINNTSLKIELPRQSTPILDRNVLNLNNDLHHTISSNAEVDTAFSLKDIPRLEEWPTFSGEGEYNHMEFMKTIYMFKEDFDIPDEYISARLHSLFTKLEKKWYYKMRQYHGKHS
ncbi:hypothetical protein O181_077158 [Austropuccinia psidii MF-1]|uniref:Uncharacterized protein n=1 Tax=Austropuccinia psidii MF-1 TaxID=1389203 RepID=A0A9Q3IDG7_9BASI|nr:hypothetical protein [Austropuccinia psidii MF-1]